MTSMPASRSARAMILAPRSCPSRPGFATTTRIFPATARSVTEGPKSHVRCQTPDVAASSRASEDGGLTPRAPHFAQRVAHLAHRHVGARGLHDRLHQVPAVVSGVLLQPGER